MELNNDIFCLRALQSLRLLLELGRNEFQHNITWVRIRVQQEDY
jgi:hypothetical protein